MCTDAIFFCDEVAVSERAEDWDKARVLSGKCGCSFESSWRDSADCIRSCLYLVWSADYVLVLCALFRGTTIFLQIWRGCYTPADV